jgi:Ca2+-binding EF-hand superfamily protein
MAKITGEQVSKLEDVVCDIDGKDGTFCDIDGKGGTIPPIMPYVQNSIPFPMLAEDRCRKLDQDVSKIMELMPGVLQTLDEVKKSCRWSSSLGLTAANGVVEKPAGTKAPNVATPFVVPRDESIEPAVVGNLEALLRELKRRQDNMEERLQKSLGQIDSTLADVKTNTDKEKKLSPEEEKAILKNAAEKINDTIIREPHTLFGKTVTDVPSLFAALDREGEGNLYKGEIRAGLKRLGVDLKEAELDKFLTSLDKNGDGVIAADTFHDALVEYTNSSDADKVGVPVRTSSDGSLAKFQDSLKSVADDGKKGSLAFLMLNMSARDKDTAMDSIMAVVICLNAVVIGISIDYEYDAFFYIDLFFTCLFLIELVLRWTVIGVKGYFAEWQNWIDFSLIIADVMQLVVSKFMNSSLFDETPPAALFRLCRLLRLIRLLRIIRLKHCEDLVAMISGMVGGMTTLMWSLLLFLLFTYVTALLFREFYGRHVYVVEGEDISFYFASVPRSMLTVFRYFFGDFELNKASFFEGIQEAHGTVNSVFVCGLFFMTTIGLFNVIAAIFVESTLAAAKDLQIQRKTERMNDTNLWTSRMMILINKLFEFNGTEMPSEGLDAVAGVTIEEAVFMDFIKDPAVKKALNDLEIDEADHKYLFDILDNDNTGSIVVSQLIDGLNRLRGDPRRSDIITVDLMTRDIQSKINLLIEENGALVSTLSGNVPG